MKLSAIILDCHVFKWSIIMLMYLSSEKRFFFRSLHFAMQSNTAGTNCDVSTSAQLLKLLSLVKMKSVVASNSNEYKNHLKKFLRYH